MQLTLRVARRTPHGASRLVHGMNVGMCTWWVHPERAPSRYCRVARVYGHTTTAMHEPPYNSGCACVEELRQYDRFDPLLDPSHLPPPPPGRMPLTFRVVRRTPHGVSCLVHAMSAWSVKTQRASFGRCRNVGVDGLVTTAMREMSAPPSSYSGCVLVPELRSSVSAIV